MKKFYLLLVLSLNVLLASAQWSVAPEVGLSAMWSQANDCSRPVVKIGAAVEYAIKPNFSIESGLYYTQRGDSWIYSRPDPVIVIAEEVETVRHLIQLPVMARFSWQVAEDTRLFISAGPYVGAYVADRWKDCHFYEGGDIGDWFDWGLSASGGVEIGRWFIRLGYDLSLGGYGGGDGINANYHQVTLSAGYKF